MKTRIQLAAVVGSIVIFAGCRAIGATQFDGTTQRYYIAADEVVWDYASSREDLTTGEEIHPFVAATWVNPGPDRVGTKYKKALYREYTDETFTTLTPRAPEWEHLGFLGPMIRAEVGDTIEILFKNNVSFPASMHVGVGFLLATEGAEPAP